MVCWRRGACAGLYTGRVLQRGLGLAEDALGFLVEGIGGRARGSSRSGDRRGSGFRSPDLERADEDHCGGMGDSGVRMGVECRGEMDHKVNRGVHGDEAVAVDADRVKPTDGEQREGRVAQEAEQEPQL